MTHIKGSMGFFMNKKVSQFLMSNFSNESLPDAMTMMNILRLNVAK